MSKNRDWRNRLLYLFIYRNGVKMTWSYAVEAYDYGEEWNLT